MKRTFLVLVATALLSLNLFADTVTINTGDASSSTDLFEGATVINYHNIWVNSDARDALGGEFGTTEEGNVLPDSFGGVSWIYFETASSVDVKQFTISLAEDNPTGNRSASSIQVMTSATGGATPIDWVTVLDQALDSDYLTTYGDYNINVVATFDTAITSQAWLIQWSPVGDGVAEDGARLMEIDGSAVPEPATASMMALVGAFGFLIRRHFLS